VQDLLHLNSVWFSFDRTFVCPTEIIAFSVSLPCFAVIVAAVAYLNSSAYSVILTMCDRHSMIVVLADACIICFVTSCISLYTEISDFGAEVHTEQDSTQISTSPVLRIVGSSKGV
jgi:hypothetical protein